jgi:hypothetical protein
MGTASPQPRLHELKEQTCSSDEEAQGSGDSDAEADEDFDIAYLMVLQNSLKAQMQLHDENSPSDLILVADEQLDRSVSPPPPPKSLTKVLPKKP